MWTFKGPRWALNMNVSNALRKRFSGCLLPAFLGFSWQVLGDDTRAELEERQAVRLLRSLPSGRETMWNRFASAVCAVGGIRFYTRFASFHERCGTISTICTICTLRELALRELVVNDLQEPMEPRSHVKGVSGSTVRVSPLAWQAN